MTSLIPLSQGARATVDSKYYAQVSAMGSWSLIRKGTNSYAVRNEQDNQGRKRRVYLHQVVWQLAGRKPLPAGLQIDHRNQNGLDNRLSNLRRATITQQRQNRRKRHNCTSKYKGVCWSTQKQKWRVCIKHGGKQIHLGFFPRDQELEAAKAYDSAALRLFGTFASINMRGEA